MIGRQRPQTASGVIFVTTEDEFGMVNVVVWRDRRAPEATLLQSQLLRVDGHLESASGVRHLIAGRLSDLTPCSQGSMCVAAIFSDRAAPSASRREAHGGNKALLLRCLE